MIFKQFFDIENYLNNSDTHVKEWIVDKTCYSNRTSLQKNNF